MPKEPEPKPQREREVRQEDKKECKPAPPSGSVVNGETSSEEEVESLPAAQEEREEPMERGKEIEGASLKCQSASPDISASPSPSPQPKHNRSSQDVGFWEGEEEGGEGEQLTVEEMIKRNRYYEEEEEEDDV